MVAKLKPKRFAKRSRRLRHPSRPKGLCTDYLKQLKLAREAKMFDLVDFYERMLRIHCDRKLRIPL